MGRKLKEHTIKEHIVIRGIEHKFCYTCEKWKPVVEFGNHRKTWDKLRCTCRDCEQYNRKKIYRYTYNYETHRKEVLKRQYGVSVDGWNNIYTQQNGQCAICRKELLYTNECHTDHDHTTGLVRGILCRDCNMLLGWAHDNPKILRRAIKYLEINGIE